LKVGGVTWPTRAAFLSQMKIALLVVILLASAACGAYRFPGPASGTGTVSGHVTSLGCGGPVQQGDQACFAKPGSRCLPQPQNVPCGGQPIPGLELVFSNGSSSLITKTDSDGAYSIELPAGTWKVSTPSFARLISGPQTLVVSDGAAIVADYVVDSGIRAAA
jgi:hypothetical protein